jgi:hypothetical protein
METSWGSFKRERFKCLGTAVTYHVYIRERIKMALHSESACCHSFWNLPSCLLYTSLKIKIYITMLPLLHGCESRSHGITDEHRLRAE